MVEGNRKSYRVDKEEEWGSVGLRECKELIEGEGGENRNGSHIEA